MKPLICVDELAGLIAGSNVLVVDCRKELSSPDSGHLAWTAGHIPGAIYADLDRELSDLSKRGLGRHPLPDETAFSAVLSRWGWTPDRSVVAYDDAGGALAAARLWWMMRLVGASQVRVLDGGWSAWNSSGARIETSQQVPAGAEISVRYDPTQLVDYDALQAGLDTQSILLIDARGGPRFRGEVEPLDRIAGHIPGARNRPFSDNLAGDGRFKSTEQLAAEFKTLLGARVPESVVHMCGSGVTACHNLLAMEQAGLHGSRLFAPSWSGWISDPSRAIGVGAEPRAAL
ncbi:MAG TPA: sulfurtransferase [Dokdonella sp.]|uniref:sulfurtransferase n=1 Tax=Dokdonella sp. TaxID=2291710 RepID=UPI002D7ECE27|nr:sulfurtransferase [Dokdonella sp.]HET9033422.1 sulfurtransferase [Dokdonella sp.]